MPIDYGDDMADLRMVNLPMDGMTSAADCCCCCCWC